MFAVAVFLIALASASSVAVAEPSGDHVKSGLYMLSATPSELAARERAIDLAVKGFFFLARPVARSTLGSKTRVAPWVSLYRNGGEFIVEFAGRPPITGSVDAPSKWRSPEEEVFTVEFRLDDGAIVQTIRGDSGTRTNRFRPGPDGVLVLDVEITSSKLSAPLRYSLTYRIAGPNGGIFQ